MSRAREARGNALPRKRWVSEAASVRLFVAKLAPVKERRLKSSSSVPLIVVDSKHRYKLSCYHTGIRDDKRDGDHERDVLMIFVPQFALQPAGMLGVL